MTRRFSWKKILQLFIVVCISLGLLSSGDVLPVLATSNDAGTAKIKEGNDFATQVLRDPWDMEEFFDVSQGIAAQGTNLSEINVQNGVFSAKTTQDSNFFFALYPGYEPGLIHDKVGARHPIDSSKYGCFYIAMKVDIANPDTWNFYTVLWAADRSSNISQTQWGQAYGLKLNNHAWKLYSVDLPQWIYQNNYRWDSLGSWQALRVSPILGHKGTTFSIDWIRLTDCQPVYYSIGNLPQGQYDIYITPDGTSRKILVAESVSPGSNGQYNLDVQGFEAGVYTYTVEKSGSVYAQGTFEIIPATTVDFAKPSMYSGEEYATVSGNSWDFIDATDIVDVLCADWSVNQSILSVDTKPISQLPAKCIGVGAGEADPIVYLDTRVPTDLSQYRYLSFRHKIDGSVSMPAEGMIIRWIWGVGRPDKSPCYYVSKEFALDVGWHTYTVDLHDSWNGKPAEVGGLGCSGLTPWKDQHGQIVQLRIDPNENITNMLFHQEFDWIRLTKVDEVQAGRAFRIRMSLNKSPSEGGRISLYYTTDPSTPKQHAVETFSSIGAGNITGPYVTFLPMMMANIDNGEFPEFENEVSVLWDTSYVAPGTYYICAEVDDGYNQNIFCSEAPVKVTSQ